MLESSSLRVQRVDLFIGSHAKDTSCIECLGGMVAGVSLLRILDRSLSHELRNTQLPSFLYTQLSLSSPFFPHYYRKVCFSNTEPKNISITPKILLLSYVGKHPINVRIIPIIIVQNRLNSR